VNPTQKNNDNKGAKGGKKGQVIGDGRFWRRGGDGKEIDGGGGGASRQAKIVMARWR